MSHKNVQLYFFLLMMIILFGLSFFVFKPYLNVIFLSSVLAVCFYPMFLKFRHYLKGNSALASLSTIFVVIVCIIVPLLFLSTRLLKEAIDVYNDLALGTDKNIIVDGSNVLLNSVKNILGSDMVSMIDFDFQMYARSIISWIISHVDSLFVIIFGGLFNFVLMILSLYYLLINGEKIKSILISWSPLPDDRDLDFINTLNISVDAVLKGRILVSIAQGFLLGIGFAIFGVGSPVFWGFVGAISSLVPILGTSIIVMPAVIFLLIQGSLYQAIGLFLWGAVCVGLIDNVLSFVFLKDKIRIHPLIILFSILGGVEFFGSIGFLLGPVIISALLSVMKIYPFIMSDRTINDSQ